MKIPTDKELEALKEAYPNGTRIQLVEMDDAQAPPIGTKGTVICVDSIGSLLVKWDNGSSINVAYGKDKVLILNTECQYCAIDVDGDAVSNPLIDRYCNVFESFLDIEHRIYGNTSEFYILVGGTQILCERQKYNYCPMCGRKLTKE